LGYLVFGKLFKDDINYGNMAKYQAGIDYKPEIKDTYSDYSIENYTDIEIPMVFAVGFGKKEKSIIYFKPNNYNKFNADFFCNN